MDSPRRRSVYWAAKRATLGDGNEVYLLHRWIRADVVLSRCGDPNRRGSFLTRLLLAQCYAKRDETREQRLLTTIEWVGEGKRRGWKYEKC